MKCCGRAADPTAKLFQACKGRSNNGPVRRGEGGERSGVALENWTTRRLP